MPDSSHLAAFGTPTNITERLAVGSIMGDVFQIPADRVDGFLVRVGYDNLRLVRDETGEIGGGLGIVPMGQWFGGRSVPCAGIVAVATAPQHRAHGMASRLMRGALQDIHQAGMPLSSLYPATQPLYRRVGYEQAGGRYRVTMETRVMDLRDREYEIRTIDSDEDLAMVRDLYARRAALFNGHLDRGEYIWARVYAPQHEQAAGYLVHPPGRPEQPEGYIYCRQKERKPHPTTLVINDLVALTPRAGRRLLSFICDYRSIVPEAAWSGWPGDPLFSLLPEQWFKIELAMLWMLRIVDVEQALVQRGYAPPLTTEVGVEVYGDDVLGEQNNGRFALRVSDGQAHVERESGSGQVKVHINGLASLYSGHATPWSLQAAGMLGGPSPELAKLAAVFAGPAPWMPDDF